VFSQQGSAETAGTLEEAIRQNDAEAQAGSSAPVLQFPGRIATPTANNRGLGRTPSATLPNRGLTPPGVGFGTIPQNREPTRAVAGSDAVWQQQEIPVCWESMAPEDADGRRWTEEAVRGSWEAVSNLKFTGWQGCEDDSRGVRIKVADHGPHVEKLGRGLDGLPEGMTLNFTFKTWGRDCSENIQVTEYCIRALAVHEFGHAIGLAHEHNRDIDREICRVEPQGPNPAFFMTDYDPTSVMNYCAPQWNNQGQLSALDVAGVRMLYGPFNEETPATIEINGSIDFGDGQFVPLINADAPPVMISLTDEAPSQRRRTVVCNGTNRLVTVVHAAVLQPDSHLIDMTYDVRVDSAERCAGRALVASETYAEVLSDPRMVGNPNMLDFPAVGETPAIRVLATARRTVGEEQAVTSCDTCAAAASEAVFADPPVEEARPTRYKPQTVKPRALELKDSAELRKALLYAPVPQSDRQVFNTPSFFSTTVSNAVWPSAEIPVCWETMSANQADGRAWTQAAVEATWEAVSNLNFTGWGKCEENHNGLRIGVEDAVPRVEALGRGLANYENGLVLNFSFENWGQMCQPHREYCIRTLAVHEFGHVIGLAHEHNREDRPELCAEEPQGPLPEFILTAYDPSSVMNYCSEAWNNEGKLTPLDVAGVRLLYGPYTEEQPARLQLNGTVGFEVAAPDYNPEFERIVTLSDANPRSVETVDMCNGDDLMVRMTITSEIEPGESAVTGTMESAFLETENCEPKALLGESRSSFIAYEPGRAEVVGVNGYNEQIGEDFVQLVSFSLQPMRMLGDEVEAAECEDCVAAASEAVFFNGPPPDLRTLKLENTEAEVVIARSPWPDNFSINLKVCEDAVLAGPAYGNSAWPEDQLTRLCAKTPQSEEPASCYAEVAENGLQWGNGTRWVPRNIVNLCEGAFDADQRIGCFSDQLNAGMQWPEAIASCKPT